MKKVIAFSMGLMLGCSAYAGQVDGDAVIGSALGAAAGAAIGSAVGGKDGAIIGGGAGGALGAAATAKDQPVRKTQTVQRSVVAQPVIVIDDREHHRHDNGKHKGHYKKGKAKGYDRD